MRHFHSSVRHQRRYGAEEHGGWDRAHAAISLLIATPYLAILAIVFGFVGWLALMILPLAAPLFIAPAVYCAYLTLKAIVALLYAAHSEVANRLAHARHRAHTKGTK